MRNEATLEQGPLTKRGLLEYLESQPGPVTAKIASIDLDSRASTVTEMLERCVAQGLAERTTDQRPREYRLSDEGRRRLDSFRSKERESPSDLAARQDAIAPTQEVSNTLEELVTRIARREMAAFGNRRMQSVAPNGSRAPGDEERTERLRQETEITTAQPHRCVRELLAVERSLSKLPRREFEKRRSLLRKEIVDEAACEKVSRLAVAEAELCGERESSSWWGNPGAAKRLEAEIAELKKALGLSDEVQEAIQVAD